MIKIDEIDTKILNVIINDASISVPKLSKKINVNSSVCYSRIKRLIKRKIIKKFTVEVNDEIIGYQVTALVGLNTDTKMRDEILENLTKLSEVREIREVTGRFDVLIKIKAHSLNDLHNIVTGKIGKIDGIIRTETFIELKTMVKEVVLEPQE